MSDFVHLHNHSEYSLLDGFSRLQPMVERAKVLGQPAIALTDHGNVHGAVDFYQYAVKAGVKPIVGVEGYVANGPRTERNSNDRFPFHMTLLAQNLTGYRNILKLVTAAHIEGFYYRPRMDRELLERHSDGVMVLSGCPSGELARNITNGNLEGARQALGWYREVFKDRYYVEMMMHRGVPQQEEINRALVELSRANGVPMVVTNDAHYVRSEDAPLQDILTCIQTNSHINDPKRLHMDDDTYYIRSSEEMRAQWSELPEACDNTLLIAESVNVELEFGRTLVPRFPCPDGMTSMEFLRKLCYEGLNTRYETPGPAIKERLEYELSVIETTQFADYFLVCWDIFKFVNKRGILSAVRGSAASSLVLYCLEVTQVDPLETKLVFERFLNVERREMPDIDMDFQDDRRGDVIKYCVERYGREHVAQIITFGTLGAKAAIRDTTRALNLDISVGDRLARLIPERLHVTLDDAIDEVPEIRQAIQRDPDSRRVMDMARALEGSVRHASTHAAGVVICQEPLTDHVALQRNTNGDDDAPPTTQYAMKPVADVGLLKMDFLGLKNLTVLDRALKLIAQHRGEHLQVADIPLEDARTFEMLSNGDTFGVFQLEGEGMRRNIKELKPTSVADVSAMIALYRPGPMEHIGEFIESKHGRRKVTYPHDNLREILEETYGIIVYQDQVLLIAREFGGYTLGEADIFRKAMGKKIPEVMAAEREKFITGAQEKGYTKELAERIFSLVEPFAGYAFNKAHSVSYAMIAYWTAYLKANYPVEYFAAFLDSFGGDVSKVADCIREARRSNIAVMGPDINRSGIGFSIEDVEGHIGGIRFGLSFVKNVGAGAMAPIIEEREATGPFDSLENFCRRIDSNNVNRRALESLIKAGAFDSFGPRGSLLEAVERIVALIQRHTRLRQSGQSSMFDMFGASVETPMPDLEIAQEDDTSDQERILWERDLLGIEITESPYARAMVENQQQFLVFASEVTGARNGEQVTALGQVVGVRPLTTRNGDRFLSINVGLLDGPVEAVVWPNVLEKSEHLWNEGNFLLINAQIRERNGRVSLSVESASEYQLGNPQPSLERDDVAPGPLLNDLAVVNVAGRPQPRPDAGVVGSTNGAGPNISEATVNEEIASVTTTANESTQDSGESNGPALDDSGVVIRVRETGHAARDRYHLEDVIRLLFDYRGDEPVILEVLTGKRLVKLDMAFLKVQPCEELGERLAELVGSDNVRVPQLG